MIASILVGGEDEEGDTVDVPALLAMAGVCRRWRDVLLRDAFIWKASRGAVVDALGRSRKRGMDNGFMAMDLLYNFTTKDDTVLADVVVFAVGTDDVVMVRRARGLWPQLTARRVAKDCPTLAKWVVEGAGRGVLTELIVWWGSDALRKVISARLSMDNAHVDWEEARHLVDVLTFLNEIGVRFNRVLHSNHNLVANVVARGGNAVVAVLQMLRRWGMKMKHVRWGDDATLWRELILSSDAIGELAAWGMKKRDVLDFQGGVVVQWAAREGRGDVLEALSRHFRITVPSAEFQRTARYHSRYFGDGLFRYQLDRFERDMGKEGPYTSSQKAVRLELVEDALRSGDWKDFKYLREQFGMTVNDLFFDREMKERVVRIVASRFDGDCRLLGELMMGWGLGDRRRHWVLRMIVSRVRSTWGTVGQEQMQAYLNRMLGVGWEMNGLGAWE